MNSHIQVLLLAAGKSSRTWPIEEKIFFRFLGKTVLEHQIETLESAGLFHITIIGNVENISEIQKVLQGRKNTYQYGIQKNTKEGIRGGILAGSSLINPDNPVLIVCSNDIVEKTAFIHIVKKQEESNSPAFFLGKKVEKYFCGGYLKYFGDKMGKKIISHIIEKPKPGTEPSNMVTLLVHLFQKGGDLFTALKKREKGDFYEETLQEEYFSQKKGELVEYTGFWQAIKYPWHLLRLNTYFLSTLSLGIQKYKNSFVAPSAILRGNIILEEGVKIEENTILQGPLYLGKNTLVAPFSFLRESNIEEGCVLGSYTEITRSVLGRQCWTHQNYIGDSVFEENVSLGAGTKIGNLRLDEEEIYSIIKEEKIASQEKKMGCFLGKNIRVGVNTSLMPGVKIGKESFLGAGLTISQDIPEKTFYFTETKGIQKKNKKKIPSREQITFFPNE